MPIFVAVLAFAIFHEQRVTGARLVGVAVGFVGVALLVGAQPEGKILGALAVVGMAACYAFGGLLTRRHLAGVRPQVVAAGTTLVAALALVPAGVAQAPGELPGWKAIGSVVFLGARRDGARLPHLLHADRERRRAYAALVTYLVPPLALAYGAIFLGERFGAAAFGGLALILGGVALGTGALRPSRLRRRIARAPRGRLRAAGRLRAVRAPGLDWPSARRRRAASPAPPSRARSHRRGVRAHPGAARARAERLRARRLLRALVGALRLQALGAAAAAAAVAGRARAAGPGRERGRDRPRRRRRGRVQGRVAQPPDARSSRSRARRPASAGSSATSSRWARGRSRCSTGSASARPTGTSAAPSPAIGHYGNCTGVPNVGGETVFDEAYAANPLVNAMCVGLLPTERVLSAKATGTGQPARALRRAHRPRRDRRRLRAREPGSRGLRREAAVGADRRPVPRQGADRGVARPRRARPRRSGCRTAAPPGSPRRSPRWRAATPASTCTSTACRCASPTSSRGRS